MSARDSLDDLANILEQVEAVCEFLSVNADDPQWTPGLMRQAFNSIADTMAGCRTFINVIQTLSDAEIKACEST